MSKRPSSPSPFARPNPNQQALDRAIVALRMQRPDEAERIAGAVLKADRGNLLAAQVFGRALMVQNRPEEAIAPFERAAQRGDDPALETDLANALAAAGRRDEALEQLRQTTARRPPFLPAFLDYGTQLAQAGRLDDAVKLLENGLALAPPPAALEFRMALALAHIKRNDRVAARALLQQAVEAAPQRPDVLAALARVMAQDGDYAGAVSWFRRALALKPDDAVTRSSLGACLLEMGDREAGEASLRQAARAGTPMAGQAITALASASHGRFFLRPSDAVRFLEKG